MRALALSACTPLVLTMAATGSLGADAGVLQRWAVLCSPELRETNVADLLQVTETQAAVEWVELAAAEAQLAELAGDAGSPAARLDLARMLRADAPAGEPN